MDDAPITRQQLMDGYDRPYARWLPAAWRHEHVHRNVLIAAAASVAAMVADQIGGRDPILLVITLSAALGVVCWAMWVTVSAAMLIGSRIRDWEESDHELAAVRRRRPHAPEADPHVPHDEYAVAVGDPGDLVTWRFQPLAAGENAPRSDELITGRPRYAAREVLRAPYDPVDAARAAEQLAEAQQEAARLEQAAIERAVRRLHDARSAAEIEAESRSTGAALRGITGQSGE